MTGLDRLAAGEPPVGVGGASASDRDRDAVVAIALLVLLAVVVAGRWLALRTGIGDPISLGLAFGLVLAGLGLAGALPLGAARRAIAVRPGATVAPALGGGVLAGAFLIGIALVGQAAAGVPSGSPGPAGIGRDLLVPWALATLVVAAGEEAVLRGAIFGRLLVTAGPWTAILGTSLAFALMHVPFYGWQVVPLDLGVGVLFAGLRLWSGGILAPTAAHAIADLATWWL